MKGLIAAGGQGTRLRPITTTQNKHEIPLANKSMIELAVDKLITAGITDIVISINQGDIKFPTILGDGSSKGVRITYVEQIGGALGVAHVLKNARPYLEGDDILFYLGDNIILGDVKEFVDRFYEQKLNCLLAISRVKDPQRFGVPVIENGKIVKVLEKPENPPSPFAVAGIYLYDHNIFDVVENLEISGRGEYEISDAHSELINKGFNVGYAEITGWWKDTGKPGDLLEGNGLLLSQLKHQIDGSVDESVGIQGTVVIEEGAKISGRSFIRGPVIIGKNTVIKDAYIGPYSSVGNNCYIQDAEIEHSLIMSDVSIDVKARIVDTILGHNVTVKPKEETFPKGHQLVVGDNSYIEL